MKNLLLSFLLFSLPFSFSFFPITVQAETSVSGIIVNPVWTVENSPYLVNDTVEVLAGAKLTIEPGVVVRFAEGINLVVHGELYAVGDAANRITFTSALASPSRGDWVGIEFTNSSEDAIFDDNDNYVSGSIIKYAVIKYAYSVKCKNANPYLENNTFLNNSIGMDIAGADKVTARIFINNNQFIDNAAGIRINRNNENEYILTPAGFIRSGKFIETAFIKNNTITSNNKGVEVVSGDNNTLWNNKITYNHAQGVELGADSENNILEKNTISYNNIGVLVNAEDTKIQQNNIKYNSAYGINTNRADALINYNNFDNPVDLYNNAGAVDASNNYWGALSVSDVAEKIGNAEGVSPADSEPFQLSAVNILELLQPTLNEIASPTVNSSAVISGIKSVASAVYINDEKVVDFNNETGWQYEAPLDLGANEFIVRLEERDGTKSSDVNLSIMREELIIISDPIIDDYPATTKNDTQLIGGTKDADTAIFIDNEKVIDYSTALTWGYTLPLNMGLNEFRLWAGDEEGRESNVTKIFITREDIDRIEVINKEKALVTGVDQGLAEKLSGHILLQVEENGEAWYINPEDFKKYYLGRQSDAYKLMRDFGLGIKHDELTGYLDASFPERLAGKIMLDVEESGEAYYIDPRDMKGHYLGRPEDAFKIMRELGLGITNENIRKIAVGDD